jgi:hypothetical protein
MTREEMLQKMDLTADEFRGLLASFGDYLAKLDNPRQRGAITRSLPSMTQALKAFGPGVTEDSLRELFSDERGVAVGGFYFLACSSGPDGTTAA